MAMRTGCELMSSRRTSASRSSLLNLNASSWQTAATVLGPVFPQQINLPLI